MSSKPRAIRVLLVTADGQLRGDLGLALRAPGFAVAGLADRGEAATRQCREVQPDVAVIDAAMPGDEGFDAVEDIMAYRPTPILVVAGAVGAPEAFQALALGALDVMPRPEADREAFARDLRQRLRLLSGVRVIQHVRGRRRRKKSDGPSLAGPPVVGIAASLGGPRALAILLKGLPHDFPAPICVVQHISEGFVDGLAGWLASESGLTVREARHGEALAPGTVLVAPSGLHLTVGEADRVALDGGPAIEGFRPSATRLFQSLAARYGPRALGVVLTGMGRDGCEGLAAIRSAGGRTLAQDEASSTVYGMPRAAVEAAAVEKVVGIDEMGGALWTVVREMIAGAEGR